jgi:hypothetical protein
MPQSGAKVNTFTFATEEAAGRFAASLLKKDYERVTEPAKIGDFCDPRKVDDGFHVLVCPFGRRDLEQLHACANYCRKAAGEPPRQGGRKAKAAAEPSAVPPPPVDDKEQEKPMPKRTAKARKTANPAKAPAKMRKYRPRRGPAKKAAPRTKATISNYRTALENELGVARVTVAQLTAKLSMLKEIEALL